MNQSRRSPIKEKKQIQISPTKPAPTFPKFQNAFQRNSPRRTQAQALNIRTPLNKNDIGIDFAGHGEVEPPLDGGYTVEARPSKEHFIESRSTDLRSFDAWGQRLHEVGLHTIAINGCLNYLGTVSISCAL